MQSIALNKKVKKQKSFNFGGLSCLFLSLLVIYHVMIQDHVLLLTVNSLFSLTGHLSKQLHVIAVGLVPVYLALMIFGAAVLSIHLGSAIQRWLVSRLK